MSQKRLLPQKPVLKEKPCGIKRDDADPIGLNYRSGYASATWGSRSKFRAWKQLPRIYWVFFAYFAATAAKTSDVFLLVGV